MRTKLQQHDTQAWLVNTGWTGGAYGQGQRISLTHTRTLIRAILSGALDQAVFDHDALFNLAVPTVCPGVPDRLLMPEKNWSDSIAYHRTAEDLQQQFDNELARYSRGPKSADSGATQGFTSTA